MRIHCTFGLILMTLLLYAQEPGLWHITDRDGLPSMTVYDVTQDNLGYIWMGTASGLCRYDGQKFKSYKSSLLKDNEILKVRTDHLGRIWFSNLSGQLFYVNNNEIYELPLSPCIKKGADCKIYDFEILGQSIFMVTLNLNSIPDDFQLSRLNLENNGNLSELNFMPIAADGISTLFVRQNEIYFIENRNGKGKIINSVIGTIKNSNSKWTISYLNIDTLGTALGLNYIDDKYLYVNSKKEYYILDRKSGHAVSSFRINENIVNSIVGIGSEMWIQTVKGIYIANNLLEHLDQAEFILNNISANNCFLDAEGNKWIPTTGDGVIVIGQNQCEVFNSRNSKIPSDEIYSLAFNKKSKELLIGHDNGQLSLLHEDREIEILKLKSSARIKDILIDHSNKKWLALDNETIVINEENNILKNIGYGAKVLVESEDNSIWYGTYGAVYRWENEKIDFYNSIPINRLVEIILRERTYAIFEDLNQLMWIGTTNGLYHYRDTIMPFLEDGVQNRYNVSTITQSKDSTIWVGTNAGLLKIKDNVVQKRWNVENGLASNSIYDLFASEDFLWIGTDNGINKLNLSSQALDWINRTDGLPSLEINAILVANNNVYAGTPKGMISFEEQADHVNTYPPPVYLTGISVEEKDTTLLDTLVLAYHQNTIQLGFVGPSFNANGAISYQYKLEGLENEWVTTNTRFVRYPNLPPGTYTFKVFALNTDQIKSYKPASLFFTIKKAWWNTFWFRLAIALAIGALATFILRSYLFRKKRERYFINHVNNLKTQALRAQMNPHFIFNSLNAIQQFLTTNNREQAMHYLGQFAVLIRLIFDQSQQDKISLDEEFEFLNLYLSLEKLRFLDAVDINLEIDPFLLENESEIQIPALVIQPIIENSFKHGFLFQNNNGQLNIKFRSVNNFIICTISDNGIGRKKAAELGNRNLQDRPSFGLKTARERLRLNNVENKLKTLNDQNIIIEDLLNERGVVAGTKVTVKIYCKDLTYLN